MLQKNEGQWQYTLDESSDGRCVELAVDVGPYLDTSLIKADVQPLSCSAADQGVWHSISMSSCMCTASAPGSRTDVKYGLRMQWAHTQQCTAFMSPGKTSDLTKPRWVGSENQDKSSHAAGHAAAAGAAGRGQAQPKHGREEQGLWQPAAHHAQESGQRKASSTWRAAGAAPAISSCKSSRRFLTKPVLPP